MIAALLLGRKGSKGFPGKNTVPVLGQPLAWYPMRTAKAVKEIDRIFLSTDDSDLMEIANGLDVEIIERPKYLADDQALGEDAYVHGYEEICKFERDIELVVLLFCNAATISVKAIRDGIIFLREHSSFDSAVTVSRYNMWSPIRARKLERDGSLKPFVPLDVFGGLQIWGAQWLDHIVWKNLMMACCLKNGWVRKSRRLYRKEVLMLTMNGNSLYWNGG